MLPTMPRRRSAMALRRAAQGESTRAIIIALIANIVIAIAKLVGGLISGSRGMLAESAHSAADSVNEIFLAVGLHRDRQPVDAEHPDGHGRERFLWAFMAAICVVSDWRLPVNRDGYFGPQDTPSGLWRSYGLGHTRHLVYGGRSILGAEYAAGTPPGEGI